MSSNPLAQPCKSTPFRRQVPVTTLFLALANFGSAARADHGASSANIQSSGPIQTINADTPALGETIFGLSSRLAVPRRRSDAKLIELAGNHVHAHALDLSLNSNMSVAYGVTDHLTIRATLPFIHRSDLREGQHHHHGDDVENGVARLGSVTGIGDATISAQFQFAHDHDALWGVSLLAGLKLPTGSTHRMSDGERLEMEHQPGSGSWDPILGIAALKRVGRLALHASAFHQFATLGAQSTELGDRTQISVATTYSARAHHHEHGIEPGAWTWMLEATAEREGKQRQNGVIDTDSGALRFFVSPGVRLNAGRSWTIATSISIPVWQDVGRSHSKDAFRASLSLSKVL